MGGIQSESALPGDSTFNQIKNNFDVASFKRICAEFNISPNTDFRFKRGSNHGLGKIFAWGSYIGPVTIESSYPGMNKFSDEGGKANDGNLIYFIRNGDSFTETV